VSGWVINLWRTEYCQLVVRNQTPLFHFTDGEAVFEVWFWHALLHQWFVMSAGLETDQPGVVYFRPNDVPKALRERVATLERQAGYDPSRVRRIAV
jgi:hypothetical protein